MMAIKYYNRLIIDNESDRVFLTSDNSIDEVVYNDDSYATLYRLDDNGYMDRAKDTLSRNVFDDLYEEYTEYDEECGREKFMFENYYSDDPQPYVKADWDNYEHHLRLMSEHGINTDYYDVTDAEIIEGVCYDASDCINQDYPNTEHQKFYKFVSTDGKEYYIKEARPFFIDEHDYVFEMITKEEFEKYDA